MELWRAHRPVVADSHAFGEEQDSDTYGSEKSDPVPHLSKEMDQDPHN